VGRTSATVEIGFGAVFLALAAACVVALADANVAAWLASGATCNDVPCTSGDVQLVARILGVVFAGIGLVAGGRGLRGLWRTTGPESREGRPGLIEAIRHAVATGQEVPLDLGRFELDARSHPALRDAILGALRARGLRPHTDGTAAPPAAGAAGRLVQLARLRDAGILTAEEYDILRRQLSDAPPGPRGAPGS
jgi:hypothetical protein